MEKSDAAKYTVVVRNEAGSKLSTATLTFISEKPKMSYVPTRFDLVYEELETLVLDPKIKTEGPTTFQWDKDGKDLPGENKPILIIENVTKDDAGDYTIEATNLAGTTVSETMRVSVVDPAKIGQHVENNFIKLMA